MIVKESMCTFRCSFPPQGVVSRSNSVSRVEADLVCLHVGLSVHGCTSHSLRFASFITRHIFRPDSCQKVAMVIIII